MRNKWAELPRLNVARQRPGSILLRSDRAFSFCGYDSVYFRSIEKLETTRREWQILPINYEVWKTYNLAAVSYLNKIFLFGGESTCYMNEFSEEGELKKDLSGDSLIPGFMSTGSYLVYEGKLFAASYLEYQNFWHIKSFDGKKWSFL